jgi:hypothetical protein
VGTDLERRDRARKTIEVYGEGTLQLIAWLDQLRLDSAAPGDATPAEIIAHYQRMMMKMLRP